MQRTLDTLKNPRNIILMALAIAINIAVGQLVTVLKLPIYLDSIGTVLVGALLGPVWGIDWHIGQFDLGITRQCLCGTILHCGHGDWSDGRIFWAPRCFPQ